MKKVFFYKTIFVFLSLDFGLVKGKDIKDLNSYERKGSRVLEGLGSLGGIIKKALRCVDPPTPPPTPAPTPAPVAPTAPTAPTPTFPTVPTSGTVLNPPISKLGDLFGSAVANFGENFVVGAPGEDDGVGAVYLYTGSTTNPVKVVAPSPTVGFGSKVDISEDIVVVGDTSGAYYFFIDNPSSVIDLAVDFPYYGYIGDDALGISVAVTGNKVLVGVPNYSLVYVYLVSGEFFSITPLGSGGLYLGLSVAMTEDIFVLGSGLSAEVYSFSNLEFSQSLSMPNWDFEDLLGFSVAVYGDNVIVVGAPNDDDGRGSAFLFKLVGSSYSTDPLISDSDLTDDAFFGFSVAVSENFIAVGAPIDNNEQGSVHLFDSNGIFIRKLLSSNSLGDAFGIDMSIHENTLLVGTMLNAVYEFSL